VLVYYFNPENDLALAIDKAAYTPPRAAAELKAAGSQLPAWIANSGDVILTHTPPGTDARRVFEMTGTHGTTRVPSNDITGVSPWGWSHAAVADLSRAGVPAALLPDDAALRRHRQLSHRITAVKVLDYLGINHAVAIFSADGIAEAIERFNGKAYLKSPWSCSGRGVVPTSGMTRDKAIDIAQKMIAAQGCVIVERALDRRLDFAALFRALPSGNVVFEGWSMFHTSASGAYQGNIVAPQSFFIDRLSHQIRIDCLNNAVDNVAHALTHILDRKYIGMLGVDMMLHDEDMKLHPCVEVNLRCTMGFVAMGIIDKLGFDTPQLLMYCQGNCGAGLTVSASEKSRFAIVDIPSNNFV